MPRRKNDELTTVETLSLFLLSDGPRHAYDIEKELSSSSTRNWIKIGVASLYKTFERLERKHQIEVKRERVGRWPERKVYSLSPEGRKNLKKKAIQILSQMENFYFNLNLGLAILGSLDKMDIAGELFERRLEGCIEKRKEIESLAGESEQEGMKIMFDYLLSLYKAEERWLKKEKE